MSGPGTAQPVIPGFFEFRLKEVSIVTAGVPDAAVVNVGETFTLTTKLGLTGFGAGLLAGDKFDVFHHIENVETGARMPLFGGVLTYPAPPAAADVEHPSGPYTAGVAPFTIPPGSASGTYRILTHIHAQNPAIAPIVAAFHDGLIVQVVPAP